MLANLRGQAYSLNYLAQAALVEGGLVPFCFPRWPELARPRPTRPRLEQRPGYNAEGLPKGADALTTPPHTPLSFYIFKVPNGVGFLPPIFCGHPLSCSVLPLSVRLGLELFVQKSNIKLVISRPESDSLVTQLGIWVGGGPLLHPTPLPSVNLVRKLTGQWDP